MDGIFHRSELIFGKQKMKKLSEVKVIIFGIGGVGSWCAEGLIRSGIEKLTLVDADKICITNINRQLPATTKTLGQVKVDVLKSRLLEINPDAEIIALQKIYNKSTSHEFELEKFDYIIDAIDSLSSKVNLISTAQKLDSMFFSSMGAAVKIDSTRIKVGKFNEVEGCPLARWIRKKLRRINEPVGKFLCVYSDEILPNHDIEFDCQTVNCKCNKSEEFSDDDEIEDLTLQKAVTNGSLAHITAIFGFTLSGLVLKDIYEKG
jgi:tRNA A37 threonylcarbamoyladenosine dehydratase